MASSSKSVSSWNENRRLTSFCLQEKLPSGATIAPLILSSDKTKLSQFSGDKSAWPVYLTIGNIAKSTRRHPSEHAVILLGYLPISKLTCFKSEEDRRLARQRLFHYCMRQILEPLMKAAREGVEMTLNERNCADAGNSCECWERV